MASLRYWSLLWKAGTKTFTNDAHQLPSDKYENSTLENGAKDLQKKTHINDRYKSDEHDYLFGKKIK